MDPIRLDVHAHIVPVLADDLRGIDGVAWDGPQGVLVVDGQPVGAKALYRPDELIGWMDRNRVERTWISIPPPLYRPHLDGDQARTWCDRLNAGLERVAARFADRLQPLGHLPIQAPEAATAIAEALVARGHTRFGAPAGGRADRALSDPAYRPLWQTLDRAQAFVFFHPGECADGRLKAFYLSNLLGNPYETSVAIGHLIFGGVVDEYPAITFCFAHGGGAAAMLAGRFERGFATARPGIDAGRASPRMGLRRLWVDCIVHDAGALSLCESVFGPSQILFGSDWPFPMGLPEPHEQLAFLTAEQRKRIFGDNAASLPPAAGPVGIPAGEPKPA